MSTLSFASPRVSFSRLTISSSSSSCSSSSSVSRPCYSVSFRSGERRSVCPCVSYSLKVKAMSKVVEDMESTEKTVVAFSSGQHYDDDDDDDHRCNPSKEVNRSRSFLDARTEHELLSGIRKETESGRLPSNLAAGMEELYQNYKNAVIQSGSPRADEIVLSNMTVLFDRVLLDVEDPFDFSPYHKAMREPFDYYMFGQNYIRPLVDFRKAYVGNTSLFYQMEENLQQGHNIVLISNHQSEADPAIISLLLESTNPDIAKNMIYVAGDRVLTDPLCKPFSMGRNLICVYSKKHMFDVPELIEMKRKANTRSLKEMALLLREGSKIVWIAPSGGRDRPDPHTGEWYPAPFDAASVDNMRRLAEHSGAPSHIYPLALLCHDIMPPPPEVEKEIGERRVVSFHGAGLSVAPEISFMDIVATCGRPEEGKEAYTHALYNSVTEQYNILKSAIHGKQGVDASTPIVSLSQPWN